MFRFFKFPSTSNWERELELPSNAMRLFTSEPEKKLFQNNTTNKNVNAATRLPTTTPQKEVFKHKTTLVTTTACVQHYFLLILVSSAPSNVQRRRDIRQTWGIDPDIKPRWKTSFLVGQSRVQSETDSLFKEEDSFGDLIRANYFDHYWNQTLKIQMGFEWAARYCKFSFLLKMDDDTFVNTRGLISLLSVGSKPRGQLYMGNLIKNARVRRKHPRRQIQDKWIVSEEEYNQTHYPNYCYGFGFVLSADIVDLFVDSFAVVPTFRIDDVYVGMLADRAGVKGIDNKGFRFRSPSKETECVPHKNILVWHGVVGKCLVQIFNQTFSHSELN